MGIASRIRSLSPAAIALAVVAPWLASCNDAIVPQPKVAVPAYLTVAVHCVTDPVARTTRCGSSQGAIARTPAAARDSARQLLARVNAASADPDRGDRTRKVIIGGQDQYLRVLVNSGTYNTFNGDYTVSVILQNLLGQPMGTLDGFTGADSTFAKVFFVGGSGVPLLSNPTGLGTFTGSGQPYFVFPEVLLAGQYSQNQDWIFHIGNPPTLFDYSLLVSVRLPDESTRGFFTTPGDASSDEVATGSVNACVIRPVTQLYCWGDNSNGQLGNGTVARTLLRPVLFLSGSSVAFTQVVGGELHACGLTAAGVAYCWGNNSNGEVGIGSSGGAEVADTVAGGHRFLSLSAGGRTTCGVRTDHVLLCWGENQHGQLGNGTLQDTPDPTPVQGLAQGVNEVAVGERHVCALLTNSQVWCWGANDDGQLGTGSFFVAVTVPGLAHAGPDAHVVAGTAHSCALTTTGLATCWGRNAEGQLGSGSTALFFRTPQTVVQGAAYTTLATGGNATCAVNGTSGATECWGDNTWGQLGDNSFADRRTPVAQFGPARSMVQLTLGARHGCGRTAANAVFCWGDNNAFQLPVTAGFGAVPAPTATTIDGLVVAAGSEFTCLRATTGANTLCAGTGVALPQANEGGANAVPSGVAGPFRFAQISIGDRHVCGVTETGQLACWGANDESQLGLAAGDVQSVPTLVPHPSAGRKWVRVKTGRAHGCALDDADVLYCWGANRHGQVGIGAFGNRVAAPTQVLTTVLGFAVGEEHTCAIRSLATKVLLCWGRNQEGQVGNASIIDQPAPVVIGAPPGKDVRGSLAAGGRSTCATYTARSSSIPDIYCWGANEAGQLGTNSVDRSTSPLLLANGIFFSDSIAMGRRHGCGTGGVAAYCWGDNGRFQQADVPQSGPFVTPTPVPLLSGGGLLRIGATADRSCIGGFAVTATCWGGRQTRGETGSTRLGVVDLAPVAPVLP